MSENVNNEGVFLTVEQVFDFALDKIKSTLKKSELSRIYVWKQRFKEGNLSHKKIAAILQNAGFHKVVEERWTPIDIKALQNKSTADKDDKDDRDDKDHKLHKLASFPAADPKSLKDKSMDDDLDDDMVAFPD